ncbi:hypothetical protein E2C01_065296 [Portunus trituberculatus]|uniref:Uncharacterized protein n=1 Tax=Portunus trituberculatus TaxID=210409 RepID=A0A5B7HP74_PORTR|nr:hypothetical protein [Portunus trituberculatus]
MMIYTRRQQRHALPNSSVDHPQDTRGLRLILLKHLSEFIERQQGHETVAPLEALLAVGELSTDRGHFGTRTHEAGSLPRYGPCTPRPPAGDDLKPNFTA